MSQFTLAQLQEFGIKPDTKLGQHFLIDDNILGVIGSLAQVRPDDIAYEPGAGVGVLTAYLAKHVQHVHAIEIDRRLEPALRDLTSSVSNVEIHWGDALDIPAHSLVPVPTVCISNLPYHVAAPIVAESLQFTPTIERYCVMVQREVADRFFAEVGSSNFGALSAMMQTLCVKTGTHKVARSVFIPQPNVDSQLVAFQRRDDIGLSPDVIPAYAQFLRSCFSQRRKTIYNNLRSLTVNCNAGDILDAAGIGRQLRPQNLEIPQWSKLFTVWSSSEGVEA